MASPNHKKNGPPEPNAKTPNADDPEETVAHSRGGPLAAKDSEWIGMRTDFATTDTLPLFPGVQFTDNAESTTVITKLLVGKTADFSLLTKPQRVFIRKHLSTVREQSKEEFHQSDSDLSSVLHQSEPHPSGSDVDNYEDEDDEPKRATHIKRRKKRSDLNQLPDDKSSMSLIPNQRRKSSSRIRHVDESSRPRTPIAYDRASWTMSNDADDEYQTQSDDTLASKLPKRDRSSKS